MWKIKIIIHKRGVPLLDNPVRISTHQIKSLQWLQKVGCLKNRGINLWSLTLNTFFFLRAPFLPRSFKPKTVFMSPIPGASSPTFTSSSAISTSDVSGGPRLSAQRTSTNSSHSPHASACCYRSHAFSTNIVSFTY